MSKIIKISALIGFLLMAFGSGFAQNCYQGNQDPNDPAMQEQDPLACTEADIDVLAPVDPNEIIGTRGYDDEGLTLQWVAATASLPYTIYFENDPELATAAAQRVEVRHKLHAKADIASFGLGAFGFGEHVFNVEGTPSSYQTRIDLTNAMGFFVDVVAGFDVVNREVFWIFQTIDPATGLPPTGMADGFLPVNDSTHCGEGFVSFSIKPNDPQCVTGDTITARASIVFDINEAIPTNLWINTIDALPPTTQLTGQEGNDNEVLLQFAGEDDPGGCGIKQYKLYVSDNYGAYSLYDTYPAGSETTFPTEYDHCYRFFCLGEDNVGNVEEMKAEAEFEYGNYNLVVSASAYPVEGGSVTGSGTYVYHSSVTLTATANSGYAFVAWTNQGVQVSTESTYSFTVTEDCQLVAQFEEANMTTQQHNLAVGWNWWSTFIEQNGIDGLSMLENELGHSGVTIKSQYDFVENYYTYYGEDVWFGSLDGITNEQGYLVNVSESCSPSMTGVRTNPSNHPITIQQNWNWIGYPVASQQTVAMALDNFNAADNDLIKSQYEFATYYEGFGWFPDDLLMTPGEGYFYYSNAPLSQTLTYATISRGEAVPDKADNRLWKTNVHAFADNISIVAVVSLDSVEQRDENLELGAFVNGECRGSARLRHFDPSDRYYAMLSVTGQDGDKIEFGYIDRRNVQSSMAGENIITFARNDIIGSLDHPYVVRFNTMRDGSQEASMTLFPNPVERNKTFSIEIPENEAVKGIVVVDMLGAEVLHETGALNLSEISGLPVAGIYIIKVITQSGRVYHGRLIVK